MKKRISIFISSSGNIPKEILLTMVAASTLMFTACEKDHLFDFTKSTGKNVVITRPAEENFTEIFLYDNVDLVITQGSTHSILLEGGENLLPGIETNISGNKLTIKNKNTYNWVRSYDKKIIAYVTLPHLFNLQYESTGTVSNTDTIREDSLFVTANGGSGYINLVVKIGSTHLSINKGSVDMNISGIAGVNYLYSNGYGPFRCADLITAFTFITNNSTNDCYINVHNFLEYKLLSLGNIYYYGNPDLNAIEQSGQGKLIQLK